MPTTEDATTWRCIECGAIATFLYPSMDPAHPFVRCADDHEPHGRTLGVATVEEYSRLARVRSHARDMSRHRRHIRVGRIKSCPICRAIPTP